MRVVFHARKTWNMQGICHSCKLIVAAHPLPKFMRFFFFFFVGSMASWRTRFCVERGRVLVKLLPIRSLAHFQTGRRNKGPVVFFAFIIAGL